MTFVLSIKFSLSSCLQRSQNILPNTAAAFLFFFFLTIENSLAVQIMFHIIRFVAKLVISTWIMSAWS